MEKMEKLPHMSYLGSSPEEIEWHRNTTASFTLRSPSLVKIFNRILLKKALEFTDRKYPVNMKLL
jgi:hypothetical protein